MRVLLHTCHLYILKRKRRRFRLPRTTTCLLAFILFVWAVPHTSPDVPVFKITLVKSTIKFAVKASVPIEGVFDKWDATLVYTSN